jgi:hypothetical protein
MRTPSLSPRGRGAWNEIVVDKNSDIETVEVPENLVTLLTAAAGENDANIGIAL